MRTFNFFFTLFSNVVLLLSMVRHVSSQHPLPAPQEVNTTVLILGGGMTGITAARSLANELNITDFLLVEARHELGGRMQNTKIGNTTIEFGANWIQSLGNNPIYSLAKKYNVMNVRSIWTSLDYFTEDGWNGENGTVAQAMHRYEEEYFPLAQVEAGRREELGLPDLSMKAGLSLVGWIPETAAEWIAEYFYHDWEMGETPVESSFIETVNSHNETFIESGSDENNLVIEPRGFKQIVIGQANEIEDFEAKVLYNKTVEQINYGKDGVTVFTRDGWKINAKYALCTFSLGVLQHDDVKFDPPLPNWKKEAYAQGHMSTYTKIFARFDRKFWNSTQFTVYADSDERGNYPVFQSLDEPDFAPGSHIYFATLTSRQSYRAEHQTDKETQADFMAVLRKMYGSDIPDPIEFKYPRWTLDPLFRGSFSSWGAGVTVKQQEDMREALGGNDNSDLSKTLFFAGEHTSRKWFGYLQGAYWEGRFAAHRIADCVNQGCVEQPMTAFVKRNAMDMDKSMARRRVASRFKRARMWS
ncbi:amine oxidase [Kalaharituber pfeilii]|nr:amine oxidase [Kalaharituber pfeilii]